MFAHRPASLRMIINQPVDYLSLAGRYFSVERNTLVEWVFWLEINGTVQRQDKRTCGLIINIAGFNLLSQLEPANWSQKIRNSLPTSWRGVQLMEDFNILPEMNN